MDWSKLDNNDKKCISVKEIIIKDEKENDFHNTGNIYNSIKNLVQNIKLKVNIVSLFLISTILLTILGKKIFRDKIKGLITRINLFHPRGKKIYRVKIVKQIIYNIYNKYFNLWNSITCKKVQYFI